MKMLWHLLKYSFFIAIGACGEWIGQVVAGTALIGCSAFLLGMEFGHWCEETREA